MLEFLIVGGMFFLWFWFSLHPGSWLGISVTGGQFIRSFRDLDRKELQTRKSLRAAGQKALAIYSSLFVLGVSSGVSSGNYTLTDILPALSGGLSGLVLAYVLLHWSTRPGGWYGVA